MMDRSSTNAGRNTPYPAITVLQIGKAMIAVSRRQILLFGPAGLIENQISARGAVRITSSTLNSEGHPINHC